MERHSNRFFTSFVATATLILGGLVLLGSSRIEKEITPISDFAKEEVVAIVPKDEKKETLSPDGKYTLVSEKSYEDNGNFTQTFSIKKEEDELMEIYQTEANSSYFITIPFNTFSPTNKYIFLRVNDSGEKRYIVLRTDGVDFSGNDPFLEVEERFYSKYGSDFVITAVTGWGGNGLLVINTDFAGGGIGPSFWFDLSNFSFIRLSNRFN